MSSALGPVDENRLRLSQQDRAILAERERQAAAERQRMEEQRRREEAERRAAEEKQRQESTPRNRNIVFAEGKGWEFIVTPTYEDPFGKRPVTKEEINPAFLASPEGAEVKASFEAAEAAAKAGQDKAIQEQIQQSISDFIGTSKAAGVVPRDIKAYYDEKTNMINIEGSNFYPVRSELSPPSQPKSSVGAPIVDEDFPILTPAPGLRGRGVFTGSTSAGRTETVIIGKEQQPGKEIKVEGGAAGGFGAYFENLGKTPLAIGERFSGEKPTVEFKPEVESMFIDSVIDVGRSVAERKSFGETAARFGYNLQNIGDFIIKNPEYAAGSLAASALFTIGTFGYGKIIQVGRYGLYIAKGSQGVKTAVQEGKLLAEATGVISKGEQTTVTVAKITKAGDIIPLQKSRMGLFTEGKQINLPLLGKKTIRVPTKPDVVFIEKGLEDATVVGSKKAAIITEQLDMPAKVRMAKEPLVETITDVYQSEAQIVPRVSVPVVAGKVEKKAGDVVVQVGSPGIAGKVAESRPVGISIITGERKALSQSLKDASREQKLQEAAAKKLGTIPEPKGSKSPFEIATKPVKLAKTSKAAPENITVRVLDRELSDIGKKAAVIIATEGTAKESQIIGKIGLGGGAAIYGAKAGVIGFGGATGAEKAADKNLTVDVETQYLTTPPGAKETSKSLIDVKPLEAPTQKTGQRADTSVTGELAKALVPKLDVGGKLAVNLVGGQMSVTKQESRPIITVKPLSLTGTRQQTRQQSRQAQRSTQLFRHATRTLTRLPRPPKRGAERKKRRKLDVDIDWDGRSVGLGVKSVFSPRKRLGQFDILPEGKKARKRFLKL